MANLSATKLQKAMEHFGLGPDSDERRAYIVAEVIQLLRYVMIVRPLDRGGEKGTRREFMRADVTAFYFNGNDHALIELPWHYVHYEGLHTYSLTAAEVKEYRQKVERFNPPPRI